MFGSILIKLLIVAAEGIFIPLMYSKVILKGQISTVQLLTFEFKVFCLAIF